MKKTLLAAVALASLTTAATTAQVVETPKLFDNVYIGLDGGVTTPLSHHPFFGSMRGATGLYIGKQITPVFGAGVESMFGVNTSSWNNMTHSSTAFDNSYVGVYGTVDLFNLFVGYQCGVRPFTIEAQAGAGWGHYYRTESPDWNFFATKVGLNFKFNVDEHFAIAIRPSVGWNMNHDFGQSATGYNVNQAAFNLMASVSYHFGNGFTCVEPYNAAEVAALNQQINDLRGALDASVADAGALEVTAAALAAQLDSCMNAEPEVIAIKEVKNEYNSVRFVFFRNGSAVITADQMPNVTMIADYMKNHPGSKVVIKGYASQVGNLDFNIRLAQKRAEAVKDVLVKRYKVAADRIQAEGQGVGHMFDEESWNRVSICTLETE